MDEIGFADGKSVGVKAANVATLGAIGFADGVVPDGFAIPFYFYDSFHDAQRLLPEGRRHAGNVRLPYRTEAEKSCLANSVAISKKLRCRIG